MEAIDCTRVTSEYHLELVVRVARLLNDHHQKHGTYGGVLSVCVLCNSRGQLFLRSPPFLLMNKQGAMQESSVWLPPKPSR
jgi:hypothetical protein